MIYVLGGGAVGTVLAAFLAGAGRTLSLYARPKDLPSFGGCTQVRVDDASGKLLCSAPRPPLCENLAPVDGDVLLLCVKAGALDSLASAVDGLAPGVAIVSTLNGVAPLRRLRRDWPDHRVVPLSILMNSQLDGPLHARLTTRPEMYLGTDDTELQSLFSGTGIRCVMADGDAAVWGKLMINLANAICALTQTTFKDLFVEPALRACYVASLDEATRVLDAATIRWQLPLAVPYRIYRWMLLHGGPLPWWVAHFKNGVKDGAYPSMVADVRAGRKTEVRELNGEIVALGEQHGLATPTNLRLVELVESSHSSSPLTPDALLQALDLSHAKQNS